MNTSSSETEKQGLILCPLGSGSRGNCLYVGNPTGAVLIDAGFSAKETLRRLDVAGLDKNTIKAVLLTHEHGDHIRGLGPLVRKLQIPAYMTAGTHRGIKSPTLPELCLVESGASFQVAGFSVDTIPLPHDASEPIAFAVNWGGLRVANLTDLGMPTQSVIKSIGQCDFLVLEANHDETMLMEGPYPWRTKQRILGRFGHLSNGQSLSMVADLLSDKLQGMVLAHVSGTNNKPELVYGLFRSRLRELGGGTLPLWVAPQNEPLQPILINAK